MDTLKLANLQSALKAILLVVLVSLLSRWLTADQVEAVASAAAILIATGFSIWLSTRKNKTLVEKGIDTAETLIDAPLREPLPAAANADAEKPGAA